MADVPSHDPLIHALSAELAPVHRLRSPVWRTLGWVGLLAALGGWLVWRYGLGAMLQRWAGAPDLAWAGLGSVLTALAAAWAAFSLGVPGRSPRMAWIVLPPALLWIAASGIGCLRDWIAPDTSVATMGEASGCLKFILMFSIPLSAWLVIMLRRAYALRPVLTAVLIGLASAAGSASLLEICHEFDAAASDLAMHALAVAIVIAANALCSGRLLRRH